MTRKDRAEGMKDVLHRMPSEMVEWLDREAAKRDRSRAWMLTEAVRQWRRRLERQRKQQ
jgi:predicted transcriptional regulator